jgi:hypothetical protein
MIVFTKMFREINQLHSENLSFNWRDGTIKKCFPQLNMNNNDELIF